MATYTQFRKLEEEGELRRAYYVFGAERLLVEEVVDALKRHVDPHDLDYSALRGSAVRDVWAALNQFPLYDDGRRKLVVVRDAERIERWEPFEEWMTARENPRTVAVFVSNEEKVDTSLSHLQRFAKTGRIVKCSTPNERDSIEFIQSRGKIEYGPAKRLLERVGQSLAAAVQAVDKLALFGGEIDDRLVEAVTTRAPAEDFVVELVAMHKGRAVEAAQTVPTDDHSRIVGRLDVRLDALSRLNRLMKRTDNMAQLVSQSRLPAVQVRELQPHARWYDRTRVRSCVRALAFIDTMVQRREHQGVLETLTALW